MRVPVGPLRLRLACRIQVWVLHWPLNFIVLWLQYRAQYSVYGIICRVHCLQDIGLKNNMNRINKLSQLSATFFIFFVNIALGQNVSFEAQVLPIFQAKCGECHGSRYPELDLTLTSYEGVLAGSDYGIVVQPGDSLESYLVGMIESGEMPQDGEPVSPEELLLIKSWIEQGALEN